MAGSRLFGTEEEVAFTAATVAAPRAAFSVAVVVKPTAVTGSQTLVESRSKAEDTMILLTNGSALQAYFLTERYVAPSTAITVTAGAWQVLGISKVAGTEVVRFHRIPIGEGSATHASSSTRVINYELGAWALARYRYERGLQYRGLIAAAGIWDRALSDAEFAQLISWTGMMHLIPRALWRLDGSPSFIDETGRNNDQRSITGTSHETNEPSRFWPVATTGRSWESYGSGAWPAASWKPYARESPWNRAIDTRVDVVHENSANMVRTILELSGQPEVPIGNIVSGMADTERDVSHPLYFARSDDPEFTLRLTKVSEWGRNALDGARVRIPDDARPAGGSDGHMCIVSPEGTEYDLWQVTEKPRGGGTLTCSWGGSITINGTGIGSAGTASHFGLAAGVIRGVELQERLIDHALFVVIKYGSIDLSFGYGVRESDEENGTYVYPAEYGDSRAPERFREVPPMGARLWLNMSTEAIEALSVPDWKKTVLKALARYGAFFGDTGGPGVGFQFQSGTTYTSFGVTDPLVSYAADNRVTVFNEQFVFKLSEGVEWSRYLKVVIPPRP